ncbi:MAG TPA: chloride channel protein [Stenotrophobium sp.]|jgi:H+/Cl- antiporter ClcA|nr:chloride channel protein [Stenotrophobium sp.]
MSRLAYLAGWQTRLVFWGGALIVGLCAASFTNACNWALAWHAQLIAHWPILGLLVTPLGLTLIAFLTIRVFPGSQGSGIPQAIAALSVTEEKDRGKLLSIRIAVGKLCLTILGLLCGASIGREGPTVHVGAAIMDAFGRWSQVPYQAMQRGLVLAGSAAGIAAAFNTPIAGIVFAIEELSRSFEERTTGTLLTAVVIAGVVSTAILGNYIYFGRAMVHLPAAASWIAVPLCGIVGGLLGGTFSRLILSLSQRILPFARERPIAMAFGLGCAVALIGWLSSGTSYGTGYQEARDLLMAQQPPQQLLFPIYKLLATVLSYLTGVPGGIFSPSLSTGAGVGADLALLLPSVPMAAMIILGMAGYFTGVTQAPMTGAVIVMEMVDDHALILPILATVFIAAGASKLVCSKPIYQAMSESFLPPPKPKTPATEEPAPASA